MERQMIPTEEEKKNGWTEKTLTLYLKEREKAHFQNTFESGKPEPRPERQNNQYSPHRWR